MDVVNAIGNVAIIIGRVSGLIGPPGEVIIIIVLTTHFKINGLVIPKNFPKVKKTIDFQNLCIESLWKIKG